MDMPPEAPDEIDAVLREVIQGSANLELARSRLQRRMEAQRRLQEITVPGLCQDSRVRVTTSGGHTLLGETEGAGPDALTIRPDGTPPCLVSVNHIIEAERLGRSKKATQPIGSFAVELERMAATGAALTILDSLGRSLALPKLLAVGDQNILYTNDRGHPTVQRINSLAVISPLLLP